MQLLSGDYLGWLCSIEKTASQNEENLSQAPTLKGKKEVD